MKRAKCIEAIYPELQDKLVITIMGACAQELYDLGHCQNFFYLQHAMGLASSIGLGLALNAPDEKVVVMSGADFKDATRAAESADRLGQQATTPFDVGAVVAQILP